MARSGRDACRAEAPRLLGDSRHRRHDRDQSYRSYRQSAGVDHGAQRRTVLTGPQGQDTPRHDGTGPPRPQRWRSGFRLSIPACPRGERAGNRIPPRHRSRRSRRRPPDLRTLRRGLLAEDDRPHPERRAGTATSPCPGAAGDGLDMEYHCGFAEEGHWHLEQPAIYRPHRLEPQRKGPASGHGEARHADAPAVGVDLDGRPRPTDHPPGAVELRSGAAAGTTS